MLAGLRALDCRIVLASSTLYQDYPWTVESISALKGKFADDLEIYPLSRMEAEYVRVLRGVYWRLGMLPSVRSSAHATPGMRGWFRNLHRAHQPDVIFMNYAYSDRLVNHRLMRNSRRLIDTHDLVSLNKQMFAAVRRCLPPRPMHPDQAPDELVDPLFYNKQNLKVDPQEYRIYDSYSDTILINPKEAELVRRNTHRTQVRFIPMSHEVVDLPNDYAGQALFPTGPNPYNLQGYLFFGKKVLPDLLKECPDFELAVTGMWSGELLPVRGVRPCGTVASLRDYYQHARFVVCPVFGGTGQQVKILEAMAHGVPVVALSAGLGSSPIQHGVNGFLAQDAAEFTRYTAMLWKDARLCRELGSAARAAVARSHGRDRQIAELTRLVS
jgi:hypothetical protein